MFLRKTVYTISQCSVIQDKDFDKYLYAYRTHVCFSVCTGLIINGR